MTAFFTQHKLYLTPLSPIHLGTGEEYELTNYIVDNGFLYAFDAARAVLTDRQKKELCERVAEVKLPQLQKFFKDNKETFKSIAHHVVKLHSGVAIDYKDNFGEITISPKDETTTTKPKASNEFRIERTAYNPINYSIYIPGSALKGFIRTALWEPIATQLSDAEKKERFTGKLDFVSGNAQAFEEKELGRMQNSAFRAIRVTDLKAAEDTCSYVVYATKYVKKTGKPKSLKNKLESILDAQYRGFSGEINLMHFPDELYKSKSELLPKRLSTIQDISYLMRLLHQYSIKRFNEESQYLREIGGYIHNAWLDAMHYLLSALASDIKAGRVALVRLGKYVGASNMTLKQNAYIKCKDDYLKDSNTWWLATHSSKESNDVKPFGWALLEVNPDGDNYHLKEYCLNNSSKTLREAREAIKLLSERREKEMQRRREEERKKMKRLQEEKEREKQKAEWAASYAAMSESEKLYADVEALFVGFDFNARNQAKNDAKYQELKEVLEKGLILPEAEQRKAGALLSYKEVVKLSKSIIQGDKREKQIKAILRQLRGE